MQIWKKYINVSYTYQPRDWFWDGTWKPFSFLGRFWFLKSCGFPSKNLSTRRLPLCHKGDGSIETKKRHCNTGPFSWTWCVSCVSYSKAMAQMWWQGWIWRGAYHPLEKLPTPTCTELSMTHGFLLSRGFCACSWMGTDRQVLAESHQIIFRWLILLNLSSVFQSWWKSFGFT